MVVWSVGNFVNHRKHKKAATATSGMLMFRVGLRDDDDDGVSAGRLDVKCYQFQPFCMTPDFHLHATNMSDPDDPCLADAEKVARL